MLNGLALFAGVGGIESGLRKWIRTVCYVECNHYAVGVIRSRIGEGQLEDAPIWDDITTFKGRPWNGVVDVITGGFPCQDISNAGKGRGIKEGTRSGLWFQFLRIINEIRPSFVFVENVSAITNRGLDTVLGQLSEAGYDARWTNLRASDVGAPHKRERMFILAYTKSAREHGQEYERKPDINGCGEDVADTGLNTCRDSRNKRFDRKDERIRPECKSGRGSWNEDPAEYDPSSFTYVGRVVDGVPNRVDRIKCLGNAVVPDQAKKAWEILTGR